MATLLLGSHAEGTVNEGIIYAQNKGKSRHEITANFTYFNKILGVELSNEEILTIFNCLNFVIKSTGDEVTVTIPNRHWDTSIKADLAEEVGRIYGYDNIKSIQPVLDQTHGGYNTDEIKVRHLRHLVEAQGLVGAINYSLASEDLAYLFRDEALAPVRVKWPLNSARTTIRQGLMTSLTKTASYNFARKQNEVQIFEQGRVYDHEDDEYNEHTHLATLYSGTIEEVNWQHIEEKADFYYVEDQVETLSDAVIKSPAKIKYKAINLPDIHPTKTAGVYINNQYMGFVGQTVPLLSLFDKSLHGKELYSYGLNLGLILPLVDGETKSMPAPKYPSVEHDMPLLVTENVASDEAASVIRESAGKYLVKFDVIDVYQSKHIEADKKSLAYKLAFLNKKETLTDEVVAKAANAVSEALTSQLGVKVR